MGGVGAGAGAGMGAEVGWAVECGICSFGENHVGVPGSAASGTRGAHAGTETGPPASVFGGVEEAAAGWSEGCGAHEGRDGGPGDAGATGGSVWTGAGVGGVGATG